jgi:hypothetical protein
LERLYEIARDKEKAAKQLHNMALVTTALGANGLIPTMSNVTDAEGLKIVNCCSSSPSGSSPKPNIPPAIKGQVRRGGNPFTDDFLRDGGKWDLADYTLDPSSRQPTKKAFHGKETPGYGCIINYDCCLSSTCEHTHKEASSVGISC